MMTNESELKLQAYCDGELSAAEARQIEATLAGDPQGKALLAELNMTKVALTGFESGLKVPETREFYWSKIERRIQTLDSQEQSRPQDQQSLFGALRRFFMPAAGVALIAIAFLIGGLFNASLKTQVESSLADPGALTYRDFAAKTTLVWLTYPAETELADTDSIDAFDY